MTSYLCTAVGVHRQTVHWQDKRLVSRAPGQVVSRLGSSERYLLEVRSDADFPMKLLGDLLLEGLGRVGLAVD